MRELEDYYKDILLAEYRYGEQARRPNPTRLQQAYDKAESDKARRLGNCYDPDQSQSEEEQEEQEVQEEEDPVEPESSPTE